MAALNWGLRRRFDLFLPNERLSFSWRRDHEPGTTTHVEVRLSPIGIGSEVTVEPRDFSETARDLGLCQEPLDGWMYFLQPLAAISERSIDDLTALEGSNLDRSTERRWRSPVLELLDWASKRSRIAMVLAPSGTEGGPGHGSLSGVCSRVQRLSNHFRGRLKEPEDVPIQVRKFRHCSPLLFRRRIRKFDPSLDHPGHERVQVVRHEADSTIPRLEGSKPFAPVQNEPISGRSYEDGMAGSSNGVGRES